MIRSPYGSAPLRALVSFLLAALSVVAFDARGADPPAWFESRCAALAPTRFDVTEEPVSFREDGSQSIDQLTVRSGRTPATHLTFGLTVGNFGHRAEITIQSLEDRANARACGTLAVKVRLSMQPMTVYVAEEVSISRCASTATYEHEMKHVAVFREVLDEATRSLAAEIGDSIGTGVHRAGSQAELERRLNSEISAYLLQFTGRWQRVLSERQDAVDSPQEYARVSDACKS